MSENHQASRPPRLASWILNILFPDRGEFTTADDLAEAYQAMIEEAGLKKARRWYRNQVLKSIPHVIVHRFTWSLVLFGNYGKVTFRTIKHQKTYTFINVAGLAVGMACCLCILTYIRYELGFDRFHVRADDIYRVAMKGDFSGKPFNVALSSAPLGPFLARDYPEIEKTVRFQRADRVSINSKEKQFFEDGILWADRLVFEVFTFPLVEGDPGTALKNPYSAVLSRKTAARYFGRENPVGQTLQIDRQAVFTVTGVMGDLPENSHFAFDILLSYETLTATERAQTETWTNFTSYTYLRLRSGADPKELERKFPALIDAQMGNTLKPLGFNLAFILQPLRRIHLYSNLDGEIRGNGDIAYIYIFSSSAFLILFVACLNFMNLAAARSMNRTREVCLRKVLGATRRKLIGQFLAESLIFSFISLFIALILAKLALPLLCSLSALPLEIPFSEMSAFIPILMAAALAVGLGAGGYPALVLAGFKPAGSLKGSLRPSFRKGVFRRGVVVFQMAVTLFLIIGTGLIFRQTAFMKNSRLSFDKDNILVIPIVESSIRALIPALKHEFKSLPGVLNVSAASHVPGQEGLAAAHLPEGFSPENSVIMRAMNIDGDFLDTMGIPLIAGRNFSPDFPGDSRESVLINETAARRFGWSDPVGKKIQAVYGDKPTMTVIGVVRDFHMASLHRLIEPLFISNSFPEIRALCLRLDPRDRSSLLDSLRLKWKDVAPGVPFDYYFLEASFDRPYQVEERLGRIFSSFSLLAVFISCLGLFGMAGYSAGRRIKEIGVRKVLGASSAKIMLLLNRELIKLFVIANLIAWPVFHLMSREWLQHFAYRTTGGVGLYLRSALLTFVVSIGAVSFQTLKAAATNPVDTLRHE